MGHYCTLPSIYNNRASAYRGGQGRRKGGAFGGGQGFGSSAPAAGHSLYTNFREAYKGASDLHKLSGVQSLPHGVTVVKIKTLNKNAFKTLGKNAF